jgi:glycosyltransferase involved in cell wall biosynthesis
MAKRSVLFVSHVSSKKLGGAELVLDDLLAGINRDRFDTVLLLQKPLDSNTDLNWDCSANTVIEYFDFGALGHRNKFIALFGLLYRVIKGLFYIPYIVKKHDIDIIYANSLIAGIFTVIPAKLLGKRFFFHEHNIAEQRKGHLIGVALGPVAKLATGIVCISNSVKESLVRSGIALNKLHLVYNGYEFSRLDKVSGKSFPSRYQEKTIRIGMVANFIPWKRHQLFLELLDELSFSIPAIAIEATIVGGELPANKDYFQEIANWVEGYEGVVKYTLAGFQDNVADYLRSFDILINPAKAEPFGLIFIEAMYLECVVIGSNEGAAPEIIDDGITGYIVDFDARDESLQTLKKVVLNVTARKEVGRKALHSVREKFSINKQVSQIEILLNS